MDINGSMKNKIKNKWIDYKKPVPPFWRKVGDFALLLCVFLSGSIMSLPIDEQGKLWTIFGLNLISTIIKFWTNTNKDEKNIFINRDLSATSADIN